MRDDGITIREATIDDLDDPLRLDEADAACRRYLAEEIPAGGFRGWLAIAPGGRAVASGGAVIDRHPPGPDSPDGRIAYIMSMSTEPGFRRRGLARAILSLIMDWVRTEGIGQAALHATDDGRQLYRLFDFSNSNEMRWRSAGRS